MDGEKKSNRLAPKKQKARERVKSLCNVLIFNILSQHSAVYIEDLAGDVG